MHLDNSKPQFQGFENPELLPKDVREEFESGRAAGIAEDAGDFLNTITGASELFLIVERDSSAIQYQLEKHSNGDVKVNLTTVPKRHFSSVSPATTF
jgi:hypothetical protein